VIGFIRDGEVLAPLIKGDDGWIDGKDEEKKPRKESGCNGIMGPIAPLWPAQSTFQL
jgi:hypothetical protein